ncbi:MAG: hypothetical protein ABSC71_17805 [Candidatus Acidiferrales bacterium]|jgi:hypothetical protein
MKRDERGDAGNADAMSIGDALRAVGFGEKKLAIEMRELVGQLRTKPRNPKLLLETLKECGRHLSATRGRDEQGDSDDAAVQVELVHNVARPAREKSGGKMGERDRQIGFQFEKETP